MPAPALRVLPNGLRVVVLERHTLPVVTLRLVVEAGAEADPTALPGTAQLVSDVLTQGTATRSARQIAESIDSIGGLVDNGAEWDSSFVTITVLNDHTQLAFDLLADMAAHPAFAPSEVERKRRQTLSGLEVVRDDPTYLADTALRRVLFAGTAYSHPEDGTLEAVRRTTPEDLRGFYARYYRPSNSILAIVGDIATSAAFEQAEKYFGPWVEPRQASAAPVGRRTAESCQVVAINKPDAVQTEIRIGNQGAPRASPDYFALSVANQILGGPASNRLFRALRTREGLTYGASSDLMCYRTLGAWVAKTFTRTPETLKSLHVSLEQMKSLRDYPISNSELEAAKGYLLGHLALEFETSDGVASQVLDLLIHNLPLDYWNRYPQKIQALTAGEVWEVTKRYLDPDRNVIVLVGNIAGLAKDLKKLGKVRVVPLADVDFGSPDLERARHFRFLEPEGLHRSPQIKPTGAEKL
jgi:zinc protease